MDLNHLYLIRLWKPRMEPGRLAKASSEQKNNALIKMAEAIRKKAKEFKVLIKRTLSLQVRRA